MSVLGYNINIKIDFFFRIGELLTPSPISSTRENAILDSIVVSIPACHAGDQGSIPCRGAIFFRNKELMKPQAYFVVNDQRATQTVLF